MILLNDLWSAVHWAEIQFCGTTSVLSVVDICKQNTAYKYSREAKKKHSFWSETAFKVNMLDSIV